MTHQELEQLATMLKARLDAARQGSAEYEMIVRQLVGVRDRQALLTGYFDRA